MKDWSRWVATFSALVFLSSAVLPYPALASPQKGGLSPTSASANRSLSAGNRVTLPTGSTAKLPSLAPALPVSVAKTGGLVFNGDPTLPAQFNLNLSSVTAAYKANISQPAQISVGGVLSRRGIVFGGTMETVTPGQLLTPAQYVALGQIAATGHQSLVLTANGAASAGFLTLDPKDVSGLTGLNVPSGVKLNSIGFTQADPFDVSGSAVVNGSFYSLEQAKGLTSALDFGSLTVGTGGLVTSSLPHGTALFSNLFSGSGMTINVGGALHNSGTISSGGVLTLSAGGGVYNDGGGSVMSGSTVNLVSATGIFANAGLIAASTGNVNFATQLDNDINLQNSGGTVSASLGSINFRDASYSGPGNLTINGGNLLSQDLNLYSGQGAVNVDADSVQGLVNVYAGSAHVIAATNNLQLGTMDVSGDPLFYNQQVSGLGGDVTIEGNLIFNGQNLAIVAGGNISTPTSVYIDTNGTAGTTADGGNIYLVAGANITNCSFGCNIIDPLPPAGAAPMGTTITVNGASITGGSIGLNNVTSINTSGLAGTTSSGGSVTMVAFTGGNTGSGTVNFYDTAVTTGGNLGGNNGSVVVIAGAVSGAAATLGTVTTTGGTGAGTGNVSVYTAQPTTSDTHPIGFDNTGSITSGNTFVPSSQLQPSSVLLAGAITASGNLTIQAGGVAGTEAINRLTGAATFQAANINLLASAGDIGQATLPIVVQASNTVTANSGGSVYLDVSGSITLGASSAGTNFQLSGSGSIVTIAGNVSAGTATGDYVNIIGASIMEGAGGGGTVSGATVFLESATGDIGSDPTNSGTPIYVRAGQNLMINTVNNAYVSQDNSGLTSSSLSLMVSTNNLAPAPVVYVATTGQGSISLESSISANKVTIINTNGSINSSLQILGTTSVNLTAENGDITLGTGEDIEATNGPVSLAASGVNIPLESTVEAPIVTINTSALTLNGQIVASTGVLTLQSNGNGLTVAGPSGTLNGAGGVNINAPGNAVYVNVNNIFGEVTGSGTAVSLTTNNGITPLTVGMLTTTGGDLSIVSFVANVVLNGTLNTGGGNVLVVASDSGSFGTIAPAPGVSVITGGGNVAMVAGSTINGAGNLFSINTTQANGQPAGSVYLSSGYAGAGSAIDVPVLMIGAGPSAGSLLATAAHNPGISPVVVISSQWLSGPLNVSSGAIVSANTPALYSVLPAAFVNSNGTLNPGQIPGGGFASFTNAGTLTLQDDPNSGMSFAGLVPIVVNTGTAMSLGTITDNYPNNTAANLTMVAPTIVTGGSVASVQVSGTLKFISEGISVNSTFSLTGNGVVIESPISGSVGGSTIAISTNAGSSADIVLAAQITANSSNSSISINTYQSGNIVEAGGLLEAQGGQVALSTEYGNIGSPAQPIQINAGTLSASTAGSGSAYMSSSQTETLNVQGQVGGTFQLSSTSPVILSGAINAASVVVSSGGLDVQYLVNGTHGVVLSGIAGMQIGDTVTATNGTVMLTAGGPIVATAAVIGTAVTLQSSSGDITTGMLTSTGGDVSVVSLAGNVNLNGSITTNGGNVLIVDNCCNLFLSTTITIGANSTITTNGGNVAMVANTSIAGGSTLSINTASSGTGGSVYLSSGGTISVAGLSLGGGSLLATTDTNPNLAVTPTTWEGPSLNMPNGAIYASNAAVSSPITVLPTVFSNSGTASFSPAQIPGGGFYSFNNSGTVTLIDDPKSDSNTPMFSFGYLVPLVVASSINSLGTIMDNSSTHSANFTLVAPAIVTGTSNSMVQVGGSIKFFSGEIDLSNPAGVFTLNSSNGSINTETAAIYGSGYTVQFTGNTVVIGSPISNAGGTINFNSSIQGMMNVYGGITSNLQANTINFNNSDGCVSANLNSVSGTVSAAVSGTNGNFSLTTALGSLSLVSVSASSGNVSVTANGGDIAIGGAVTGSPTSGTVSLTAAGNIEGTGLVSGSTVSLTATTGSIDASGNGSGTAVNTATANLQLSASAGSAYVNNTMSGSTGLSLNGSNISVLNTLRITSNNGITTTAAQVAAGTVSLTGYCITVGSGSGIMATSGDVSLTATGDDIKLDDAVTSVTGNVTMSAQTDVYIGSAVTATNGTVSLTGSDIEGTGLVSGSTVSLTATTGSIDASGNGSGTPVNTAATQTLALSSAGNAYVSQDSSNASGSFVTLTSAVPGTLNVSAGSNNSVDLNLGSPFSAANVIIINNNNGGINLGSTSVTGTTSINLQTMNGNITTTGGTISSNQITLMACEGTVGRPGVQRLLTVSTGSSPTLSLQGDDGVYVSHSSPTNTTVSLQASGTADSSSTFDLLVTGGNLSIDGGITGPSDASGTIAVKVTSGSLTVNSDVQEGMVTLTTVGANNIFFASGTVSGTTVNINTASGNVINNESGTNTDISQGNLFLTSTGGGNFGSDPSTLPTPGQRLTTDVPNITISTRGSAWMQQNNDDVVINGTSVSATFDLITAPGSGANIRIGGTLHATTLNLNADGSILESGGLLSATNVNLTANGSIGTNPNNTGGVRLMVSGLGLTAVAGSDVFISHTGSVLLGLSSAGSGNTFDLLTDSGSSITIDGDVTAGTITGSGTINLTAGGDIVESAGTLTAGNVNLVAGSIGGPGLARLQTAAGALTAQASGGNVYINQTGAVSLGTSYAGSGSNLTFDLIVSGGDLTIAGNVNLGGNTTSLYVQNGNGLVQSSGEVYGASVTLKSDSGNIGSDPSAGGTAIVTAATASLMLDTSGSAYVDQTGAVTLSPANVSIENTLQVTSSGTMTVSGGTLTAGTVNLATTGGNDIALTTGVDAGSGSGNVTINSSGNVTGTGTITGALVSLTATDNIQSDLSVAGSRVNTAATSLDVSASNAFLSQTGNITLGGANVTVTNTFDITDAGSLTVSGGTLTAGTVKLATTGGNDIALTSGVNADSGAGNVTLNSSGNITGTGTITGALVSLTATDNIQSNLSVAASRVNTVATSLDVSASNAFLSQTGSLTLNGNHVSVTNTFDITDAGSLTVSGGTLIAGIVNLATTGGNDIALTTGVNAGSGSGNVTINSSGNVTGTGTITGALVSLTATDDIQSNLSVAGSRVNTAATSLDVSASNAFLSQIGSLTINGNHVSVTNTFDITAAGTLTVSGGTLTAGTVNLATTGGKDIALTSGVDAGSGSGNVTINSSGNVTGAGTITGALVSLTATDNIQSNLSVAGSRVNTAATSLDVSASNAFLSQTGSLTINGNHVSVTNTFDITDAGSLTISGSTLTAGTVNLATTGGNDIALTSGVDAGSGSGNVTINSSGNVTGTGTITGALVSLTATDNIQSDLSVAGSRVNTAATSLDVSASNAFLSQTGSLTINGNHVSVTNTFDITDAGSLTVSGGTLAAGTVNLATTGGNDIALTTGVNAGSGSGNVTINSSGNVTGTGTITGALVSLTATDNIQSNLSVAGSRVNTAAASLDVSASNAFLSQTGSLTLNGNHVSVTNTFDITDAGSLTISGSTLTGGTVNLATTGGNDIALTTGVDAGSGSGNVTINSSGNVTGAGTITGALVSLTATDNIQSNLSVAGSRVNTAATSLDVSASNAFIGQTGALTLNSANVSVANTLNVSASITLTVSGSSPLTAGTVTLSTSSGDIVLTSGITVNTGAISLSANGSITGVGLLTTSGQDVILTATNGSIGTGSGSVINTAVGTNGVLTASAVSGTVYIQQSGNLDLGLSQAGSMFQLNTVAGSNSNITILNNVSANSSSGTVNLTADGSIIEQTGVLIGSNVYLTASQGSIGSNPANAGGTRVNTTASNMLTATAAGDVYISQNNSNGNAVILGASSAGNSNTFDLTTGTSSGGIAISGEVSAGTINLTTSGSLGIAEGSGGLISGTFANVNTTSGFIGSDPSAGGLRLETAVTNLAVNSTGGSAFIDNAGSVVLEQSNVGSGAFNVQTKSGSNGGFTISGGVTAGSITLNANGSGSYQQVNGVLTAASVTLASASGAIGSDPNNSGVAINTAAGTLMATTSSNVYISQAGSVDVKNSYAGGENTFQLTSSASAANDGTITVDGGLVSPSGTMGAVQLTVSTGSGGAIVINSGNVVASAVTLTTDSGNISTASGSTISAQTIILKSNTGDFGTNPAVTGGMALSTTSNGTVTANTGGNVFIANTGTVSLGQSSAGTTSGLFQFINDGATVTVSGTVTGRVVAIQGALNSNGGVVLSANVMVGNNVGNDIVIAADGAGTITTTGGTLSGNSVTLISGTGDIGSDPTNSGTAISTQASLLTATTGGNVYIAQTGTVMVSDSSAGSGKTFYLTNSVNGGDIDVNGTLTGGSITLIANNGGINIGSSQVTAGSNLTLMTMNGNLTSGAHGLASGGIVTLNACESDIGTSTSQRFNVTSTQSLTMQSDDDLFVHHIGTVNLLGSSAGGTFDLLVTGGDLQLNGQVTASTVTLAVSGSGNIVPVSGSVSGTSIQLSAANGNVGTASQSLQISGGTLTASTKGSAYISSGSSITLNSSMGLANFVLNVTNGNLSVNGNVNYQTGDGMGNVSLSVSGGGDITTLQSGLTVSGNIVTLVSPTIAVGDPTLTLRYSTSASPAASSIYNVNLVRIGGGGGGGGGSGTGTTGTKILTGGQLESSNSDSQGSGAGSGSEGGGGNQGGAVGTQTTPQTTEAPALNGTGGNTANVPAESSSDLSGGISGTTVDTGHFDSKTIANLRAAGVDIGEGSNNNLVILNRGNMLLQPTNDMSIQVQEGTVYIPNGAMAFVIETGHDLAVYDMQDGHHGSVKVRVGKKLITLTPGKQLVLTRQLATDFDHVNPGPRIAHRGVRGEVVAEGIKAYAADFSIPSIMMNVAPLKRMLASDIPSERRAAHKLLKNAVILAQMTGQAGPYQSPAAGAPIQP